MDHTARILRSCGELARCIGIDQPISVLLVDDEAGYCALFKAMLARVVGTTYRVDVVDNAEAAAFEIEKGQHDLYVIDLRLNNLSGIDLVHQLQQKGEHFPFVILTGADTDDRIAMGRDCMMWLHKGDCASPQELDRMLRYSLKNWLTREHSVGDHALPPMAVPA